MKSTEYFKHVKRTESPTISTVNNRILHGAIGIGTEAGEVLDAIKKSMFYGRSLNLVNLKEELGDLLWYMGLIADEIGTTFEQLMDENIIKLKTRYPEQFTPEDEMERDYSKEAEAIVAVHPNPPAPRPIGSPVCFGQTCDDCGDNKCDKCRETCDHCIFQEMCAIAMNKGTL
jgi:NTP pyrophosphatase (non-canonical NTP hydrolase)